MLRYLLRRILLALPTLFVISLITFGLNKCAPGDPVRLIYGEDFGPTLDPEAQADIYRDKAAKLGLDKPAFYFSLTTPVFPDTLYRVFPPERRTRLAAIAAQCGDWGATSRYDHQLAQSIRTMELLADSLPAKPVLRMRLSNLLSSARLQDLSPEAGHLAALADTFWLGLPFMAERLDSLRNSILLLGEKGTSVQIPVPVFYWHGVDNQYHKWLTGFASGNLGVSFSTKRPVWEGLAWYAAPTLFLNGTAILLAYLLAVPLGVGMARRKQRGFDTWTRRSLLLLYAMPVFWLGSLLILFFATPGLGLNWISGISLDPWQNSGKPFFHWCWENASKFILPILTLTTHTLAVLAMQMRGGMLNVVNQDYIRTARAKGVWEDQVYWRHALRNALFPIITIFGSVFPAVFAGSLVIEYLFQFPGMGMKVQGAFMNRDYPVLFAILMFSAALTILGNLVADLLFAWADPRVRFEQRKR